MTNNKVIKIYSKNKDSLKRFIQLLSKLDAKWKNLTFVVKPIKKRKNRITVLKSPHVNKKAQTQFQATTYGVAVKYSSWEIKKNYVLIKKIKNHLFPDVKIKIKQNVLIKKIKQQITTQFVTKNIYYYSNDFKMKQKVKKKLLVNGKENKITLLKKNILFYKSFRSLGCIP